MGGSFKKESTEKPTGNCSDALLAYGMAGCAKKVSADRRGEQEHTQRLQRNEGSIWKYLRVRPIESREKVVEPIQA